MQLRGKAQRTCARPRAACWRTDTGMMPATYGNVMSPSDVHSLSSANASAASSWRPSASSACAASSRSASPACVICSRLCAARCLTYCSPCTSAGLSGMISRHMIWVDEPVLDI